MKNERLGTSDLPHETARPTEKTIREVKAHPELEKTVELMHQLQDLHLQIQHEIRDFTLPRRGSSEQSDRFRALYTDEHEIVFKKREQGFGPFEITDRLKEKDVLYDVTYESRTRPESSGLQSARVQMIRQIPGPSMQREVNVALRFNERDGKINMSLLNGRTVLRMETDGVRVANPDQDSWKQRWAHFYRENIIADRRFQAFVTNRRDDVSSPEERHWWERLQNGHLDVTDVKRIIDELEGIWNASQATALFRKKFPRNKIPSDLGTEMPQDILVSHESVQKELKEVLERLRSAYEALGEKLKSNAGA